jgi:hypothetical protein
MKGITLFLQLFHKLGPLGPEDVGASQRAIATTDDQSVYALFDEIMGSCQSTLRLPECRRSGSPDECTTLDATRVR